MADLDVTQLELITPHVTTQLQVFNSQVVAHLKNYKPEIGRIYDRLGELAATNERLEGHLNAVESDVNRNHDQSISNHDMLSERLAKVEQLLSALPSWKEDLVGRIEALTRETRAKHDATNSRTTVLEDSLNSHIAATRERLDMLTTVARTASEARAQQQERIDEMDTDLRRLREATEREANETKTRLRRHDEQLVMANSKLADHGGQLSGNKIELARLKDSSDQHNRQLENLARGVDKLHDISAGLGQEVNLMKRGMAATDTHVNTLESKVLSDASEFQGRIKTLEEHRNLLFHFKDETHAAIERIDRSHELMTDRVQMLDAKVEAGPPGLWKMASQVAAHEDELALARSGLASVKSTNEELTRRLEDMVAAMSHHRDVASQLREECRMLADRLTAESARSQQYVDDQLQPLARRYELEALRKNVDAGVERLEAALAGSGERLKFELLHDEAAQVGSIREYMGEVERRNADLVERVAGLEAGLAGEAERGRSVAAVTRELRGALDGLLCTSQTDLARLRATMTSMHEEYEEMSKKARRAGLLTVTQVEDLIDMRLNSPVLDSVIARKLAQMQMMPMMAPMSPTMRANGAAVNVAFSYGRFTSGAIRPGAAGPSWTPSSVQRALTASPSPVPGSVGSTSLSGEQAAAAAAGVVPSAGSFSGGLPPGPALLAAGGAAPQAGGVPMILEVEGDVVGGGPGGAGGSADPALGLRLVAVETDMSRMFEAFKALGSRVAPVSEVADLRQELADLTATVAHVKVSQGVLGEAGEEAVRRHVHATLLPELLRRQSHEARRVMGWMDEQLIEVMRELSAVKRTQARLQARLGDLGGVGGGSAASPAPATAGDIALSASEAASEAASTARQLRQLSARPISASASPAGVTGVGADGDVVALAERMDELSDHLSYLADVLGLPLKRRGALSAEHSSGSGVGGGGRSSSGAADVGGGRRVSDQVTDAVAHIAASTAVAVARGSDHASSEAAPQGGKTEAAAAPDANDTGPQEEPSEAPSAATLGGGVAESGGFGGHVAGTPPGGTGAAAPAPGLGAQSSLPVSPTTLVDGLTLSLPSLLQRIQQLEMAVHTISAGQQALTAAAAATVPEGAFQQAPLRRTTILAGTPGSGAPAPTVAAAAAVQGLVESAVAELRLRVKLLEQEAPLMARSFEVKALRRIVQEAHTKANTVAAAVLGSHGSFGGIPLGLGSGAAGLPPPGGKVRANGSGRSGALSVGDSAATVMDPQLSKRLSALELQMATIDERGRAMEERWGPQSEAGGRWGPGGGGGGGAMSGGIGGSLGHGHGDVSRLQATVSQLTKEVQRLSSTQAGGGGRRGGDNDDGGGLMTGGGGGGGMMRGGGIGGMGGSSLMMPGPFSQYGMADVVNVELSGIAHDLALAAHEELQRVRDGPLPDGTQEGLPTPAAQANREAALARLRRKPLEVAAHVELLESVKLHLDRLMRRSASCTTDWLVLMAAMGSMRVKLLENEAEAFREQIIAVFRSLERAFGALVKLQEAVSTKSSAATVSSLANMLQDISAGLATLATHAAMRDTAPLSARGTAAAAAVAAASVTVEQARRRQGSAGALDGLMGGGGAANGPPGSSAGSVTGLMGGSGPLDDALQLLANRGPSPTGMMRPASPVRLSGPGMNTAANRQHAAAARGAGGSGGSRHGAAASNPGGPQQSWPGTRVASSPVGTPSANAAKSATGPLPSALGATGPSQQQQPSRSAGGSGSMGGAVDLATLSLSSSMDAAMARAGGAGGSTSGPNRMWSGRRPGSAVVTGLHVGVPGPGSQVALPTPGSPVGLGGAVRHGGTPGQLGGPGLPSISASGLGRGQGGRS